MYKNFFKVFALTAGIIFTALPAMAAVFNVPSQFSTISLAMANAQSGDSIIVAPGTYTGSVVMTEGVRLIGKGTDVTTIVASAGTSPAVTGASNSILEGFTIKCSMSDPFSNSPCVYLNQVRNMVVSHIKITGTMVGAGLILENSHYNVIQSVTARTVDVAPNSPQNKTLKWGLVLLSSHFNHILSNNFKAMCGGITVDASAYNRLEHNFALIKGTVSGYACPESGERGAIHIAGGGMISAPENVLLHNTGISRMSSSSAGLVLYNSPNTMASHNIFYGLADGIYVEHSVGNTDITLFEYTSIHGKVQDVNLVNSPVIVYGNGMINGDPMVNVSTGALQAGSPCINTGNPSPIYPHDPDGSIADLGAFYF